MSNMPKPNKVVNGHWWQHIKWRNLLTLIIFLLIILVIVYLGYSAWADSVTSPSKPMQLSFTISPAGGGKNDRLVSTPISPSAFNRTGPKQAVANLIFGPWEKALKIREVAVHPMLYVEQDKQIEVTLSFKDQEMKIGSYTAKGDPNLQIGTSAHLTKSFDDLLIPPGDSGTINIVAKEAQLLKIHTETYVWFDVLQARSAPVGSLWDIIVNNPLAVGLFIALLPIFARGIVYETESERRQKEQIIILRAIEKHLGEEK